MAAGDGVDVVHSEDVDQNDENTPHPMSFTLPVLQVVREAQQQHGLRHGDMQRYRQYCARRLRRIRKSLHFPQGYRNKVQPKKITEEILTDVRYLYLPLMEAERAWAYSLQLKSEANTEPRKRFHMVNRLKKSVQHTEVLQALCDSDKCDALTQLEVQAYCAWMKATLQFEMDHWKAAIELFTSAKTIYEKLASTFVDELKDVYLQRVNEISPNIRYCAYNIGDESAINDLMEMRLKSGQEDGLTNRLDELIEKTREKQASSLLEVTWRGRTVPIKNEKVRVFLLSLQESETHITDASTIDSKLSVYESLLKELIDAQQCLKDDLRDDPLFKALQRGQVTEEKVPNMIYLHTYLTYLRQTKTAERNLLMAESLKTNLRTARPEEGKKLTKPQDLARLYDIIIQNLAEVSSLPGLEYDDDLQQDINTQIVSYKAFRCSYIAQTYAAAKKWRETLALCERTLKYAQEALASLAGSRKVKSTQTVEMQSSLEDLVREVEGMKYSCHASSILDTQSEVATPAASKTSIPLSERLDEYIEDPNVTTKKPNLTQFPPSFEPVPCKPLFFDVALSLVEFPSLEDKLQTQKAATGGLTGIMKGWLWGGKKK
ncbi:hypothetical protein NP493_386g05040 [Ridgeia piscesae]|uniref:Signal recognition particle subunit SRP68 n=1 Tax=Ridgeia piscesae TaxID=27915 RepID=A0AAD9L244_RIDPI|nr:hypothetical protein NP493_386g05040 [Ridgeia piscesae]